MQILHNSLLSGVRRGCSGTHQGGCIPMSKIAFRIAGVSVASALACGLAGPANAQLLAHKDISLAMATTIARAAMDACKAQGYNVSRHVLGPHGQLLLAVPHHTPPLTT